jgi:hypothetical protein
MRSILPLLMSLSILLHTLLGWCPQHVGCAAGTAPDSNVSAPKHHHCSGHHHHSSEKHSAPTSGRESIPPESESHSCDHADCLFVNQAEPVLDSAPASVGFIQQRCVELPVRSFQSSELRHHVDRLFLTHSQGQAARIARGVWLI